MLNRKRFNKIATAILFSLTHGKRIKPILYRYRISPLDLLVVLRVLTYSCYFIYPNNPRKVTKRGLQYIHQRKLFIWAK